MSKTKDFIMIIFIAIVLLLIPNISKATETFTSGDIVATKIVEEDNKGNIEFNFTNIELSAEGNYVWSIGTTSSSEDITTWYTLGDYSETNKTATIDLLVSNSYVLNILRTTDTAWLYIKDSDSDELILDALEVDLTLPPYYAFTLLEYWVNNSFYRYHVGEGPNHGTSYLSLGWVTATYNIENAWYSFELITDETLISNYEDALEDGTDINSVFSITTDDISELSDWTYCSNYSMYYTAIETDDLPTEDGFYILYLKAKDSDTKSIYGYKIIEIDNEEDTDDDTDDDTDNTTNTNSTNTNTSNTNSSNTNSSSTNNTNTSNSNSSNTNSNKNTNNDSTTYSGTLPYTGVKNAIILASLSILAIMGYTYFRYNKYKGID